MSQLDDYDYRLPAELIAQRPLANRADARLMIVERDSGRIVHRHVRDLPELLTPDDCLVLNDTRVVPARLVGYRIETSGRWEGLYLRSDPDGHWHVLCKTRGRQKIGDRVRLVDRTVRDDIVLRMIEKLPGGEWLVHPEPDEPPLALLDRVGRVPLPHYIRGGEMLDADRRDYQTVFARNAGAVAAPTAGLHFTAELLARIEEIGVTLCYVTLHVGPGTFRPIKSESLDQHAMHSELGQIDEPTVRRILDCRTRGGRVVAVGTTTVRLLETAAANGELAAWSGETDLFIRPPFQFRVVQALLTNFHLPRSTLLVLVSAFGGMKLIRQAYQEAIAERYRLFSYGDAMLIL